MKKRIIIIFLFVFCMVSIIGCSNSDSIVGTWKEEGGNSTISFYDDGSCMDVPIHTLTSADAVSYKVQEDGRLIFTMEWDGPVDCEKCDNEDEALNDRDLYYLNGDVLILNEKKYIRK